MKSTVAAAVLSGGLLAAALVAMPVGAQADVIDDLGEARVIALVDGAQLMGVPFNQFVSGQSWVEGDVIELFLNGVSQGTSVAEANAEGSASPSFEDVPLQTGDLVTLTAIAGVETGFSSSHVVLDLALTEVSTVEDTVAGTTTPFAEVVVLPDFEAVDGYQIVTADASGAWLADFSATYDIVDSTWGGALRLDEQGNATGLWWAGSQSSPECTIEGTDGNDRLVGTQGDDVICGYAGDDVLIGLSGDDVLLGGIGDDRLIGGPGSDHLDGGDDIDRCITGPGLDSMANCER